MNFGLVVEGEKDNASYRALIPRIRNDATVVQARSCAGKQQLKNTFVGHLKEYGQNRAWQIERGLVIRDSDCQPAEQIEEQLRHVLESSGHEPGFDVVIFATPCMLESWLLGDLEAIRTVAARRGARPEADLRDLPISQQPSRDDDEVFMRVLSRFGLSATPAVHGEIAAVADLALIEHRCTYFREFCRRVRLP